MKRKIINISIAILLIFIIGACSNDDDNVLTITGISVVYNETKIENTFFEEGATLPPTVDWDGEKGTFSSSSEVVTRGDVKIDKDTGVISWERSIPLGEVEIDIKAANSSHTTMVKVVINTVFKEGVFFGGFNDDTSDEPDYSNIDFEFYIQFFENGTLSLSKPDDPGFSGTGTWQSDGPNLSIRYETTESAPDELIMVGFITNGTRSSLKGVWGRGLDSDGNVQIPRGVFSFFVT
ncbi:hypothetical protein ATO12_10265 [Aquimarina atlantica]|uniref:BIG2 domain-containing protein n=1 Tax=Aquimarina atlantica TaxID=1317122 RepID=A0A023BYG6_9FLAO|nr:hypothetical protein [Aquimarina atlantica]EZH75101.1 hypothetical protein ATO12_10265 [Aquimarina atlantica]